MLHLHRCNTAAQEAHQSPCTESVLPGYFELWWQALAGSHSVCVLLDNGNSCSRDRVLRPAAFVCQFLILLTSVVLLSRFPHTPLLRSMCPTYTGRLACNGHIEELADGFAHGLQHGILRGSIAKASIWKDGRHDLKSFLLIWRIGRVGPRNILDLLLSHFGL